MEYENLRMGLYTIFSHPAYMPGLRFYYGEFDDEESLIGFAADEMATQEALDWMNSRLHHRYAYWDHGKKNIARSASGLTTPGS